MRRREVIAGLAGSAGLRPIAVKAQSSAIRQVGVLMGAQRAADGEARVAALRQGLIALGWEDGRNLRLDVRWSSVDRLQHDAAEMARSRPDLVLAVGSQPARAFKRVDDATPVVFVGVADPVGLGLVESLARPGGSVTGFTIFEPSLGAKLLQLLRELAPALRTAGYLFHPDESAAATFPALQEAARLEGLRTIPAGARVPDEISRAIEAIAAEPRSGLLVPAGTLVSVHRQMIIDHVARLRMPAVYAYRSFAENGGLCSYGVDILELYRRSAAYVDRLLKGERAADLPVQRPTKFELVINLKTAETLGISVPSTFLARADEVIE